MQRNYDTMVIMKDYMMWLVDRGHINEGDDIIADPHPNDAVYAPILVDAYKDDAKWHGVDTGIDEDDIIDDDEDDDETGIVIDDDELGDNNELLVDCSWTPEEHWITPNGGITADASVYLHELDSKGELI
jgi:hypothetical protein